ncbi:MAG: zinc ABC transporter substrate-binding protein [Anaerolineae bacterium]|nr:zinc ABC transporter substrate-binding protein [Anaerolineae bacterium]
MQRWALRLVGFVLVLPLALGLVGCGSLLEAAPPEEVAPDVLPALTAVSLSGQERLRVVATTSLVADVVQQVGGDTIDLRVLVPLGADPHSFTPAPQDAAAVANAHVVFINGAGLEAFLEKLLESAGAQVPIVPVSAGIMLLEGVAHAEMDVEPEDPEHHPHEGDPHTWFSPRNVERWTQNIAESLSALDPAHAADYAANATAYTEELEALDLWILDQVAQIPPAKRKLVTDHTVFTYFAEAYGFEQLGAIIPGYSTLASPSAQDLARLEDAIREFDVPAVFVGVTLNPSIAAQVAQDTGVRLVPVYQGSLSEAGGPADTYLAFMRYNVNAIVDGLR